VILIALDLLAAGFGSAVLVYYVARDADRLRGVSRADPPRWPASGCGAQEK
jgi:hypothetical protein